MTWSTSDVAVCKLPRAFLLRLEQSHFLDGNDCLIGEGRYQLDLPFSERPHRAPHDRKHANRSALAQERNTEHGPNAHHFHNRAHAIFRVRSDIMDMDDATFE